MSVAADGSTEANIYFRPKRKCKSTPVPCSKINIHPLRPKWQAQLTRFSLHKTAYLYQRKQHVRRRAVFFSHYLFFPVFFFLTFLTIRQTIRIIIPRRRAMSPRKMNVKWFALERRSTGFQLEYMIFRPSGRA